MRSVVTPHVIYFFLHNRRPPRTTRTDTLFPYTTLFRSSATGGPSVNFGFSIPKPAPAQPLIPPPRAPNNLSPLGRDAALREGRFRSLGVEQPTTGMVTRDPRAWNFERETAKRYGAGDELIGQFQNVEKQLVEIGRAHVRSQGGAKGPDATGLAVQKALDAKRKEMQEATDRKSTRLNSSH